MSKSLLANILFYIMLIGFIVFNIAIIEHHNEHYSANKEKCNCACVE